MELLFDHYLLVLLYDGTNIALCGTAVWAVYNILFLQYKVVAAQYCTVPLFYSNCMEVSFG